MNKRQYYTKEKWKELMSSIRGGRRSQRFEDLITCLRVRTKNREYSKKAKHYLRKKEYYMDKDERKWFKEDLFNNAKIVKI